VYLGAGVVKRADRDDNLNALGSDLDKYLHVLPGDLVFNKLRTWQGGLGASKYEGIVSPAYYVLRPREVLVSEYAHYLLTSRPYLAELTRLSKFMPPSQFDITWDALKRVPMLVPPIEEQRRIVSSLSTIVEESREALDGIRLSVVAARGAEAGGDYGGGHR
jgi:type I restriction enzyme S subunit